MFPGVPWFIARIVGAAFAVVTRAKPAKRQAVSNQGVNLDWEGNLIIEKYFMRLLFSFGLFPIICQCEKSRPKYWRSLTSADSGLQLHLEIALNSVSAKIQPHGLL
jgi:hypothetical protein